MNSAQVRELVARVKPRYLMHLAWCAGGREYRVDPANEQWREASIALAHEFFAHGGVRAVFAGTSAEHEAQARPTLYAQSKAAAASGMAAAARAHRAEFAWGRIFLPYGPFDAPHRFVPSVIDALLAGHIAHCSPGRQIRDFVHVADAGRALIDLLGSQVQGPADIGTGIGTSVRDAAEQIAAHIGTPDLLRFDRPAPEDESEKLVAAPHELLELGWRPRFLQDGLAQTVAWHRARIAA